MRHFKVNYNWGKIYNSFEFDKACEVYDKSSITSKNIYFNNDIKTVYISTLLRAEKTFESLGLDDEPIKTSLLDEVPLKSFVETSFKMPLSLWLFFSRLQCLLNIGQGEKISDVKKRINNFINLLEEKNQDCLVIGHGFYLYFLKKELKKRKYLGVNSFHHKNGDIVEFSKSL